MKKNELEQALAIMQSRKITFEFQVQKNDIVIDHNEESSHGELRWMFGMMMLQDITMNESYYRELLGQKQFVEMADGVSKFTHFVADLLLEEKEQNN